MKNKPKGRKRRAIGLEAFRARIGELKAKFRRTPGSVFDRSTNRTLSQMSVEDWREGILPAGARAK